MNTVELIHAEIDSAEDRILKRNIEIKSKIDLEKSELEKLELMKEIGFVNSKSLTSISERANELKRLEENSNLILEYKKYFPELKFITIEEFDIICDKYNLIYSNIENYIEDIPLENLREIKNAKSLTSAGVSAFNYEKFIPIDEFEIEKIKFSSFASALERKMIIRLANISGTKNTPKRFKIHPSQNKDVAARWYVAGTLYAEIKKMPDKDNFFSVFKNDESIRTCISEVSINMIPKKGLFIAGPKSHFNLADTKKSGKKGFFNFRKEKIRPEPDDPIVFRFCKGGIQVLSKWGAEEYEPKLSTNSFESSSLETDIGSVNIN